MKAVPSALGDLLDGVVHWVAARLRPQVLVWLLPLGVLYGMLRWPIGRITHIIAGVLALGVVVWAIRRPGRALIALVVFLPLQSLAFGFLLRFHVPAQVLKPAGGLKELLAVGILISAFHAIHTGRTRYGQRAQLDGIDKALIAYVAVVTVYVLVPHLFSVFPVSDKLTVRLLSWRADCGYALLFFGARHAPISATAKKHFVQVLMAMAMLTVACAFYEWARPDSWERFILISGRQIQYQFSVLDNSPATVLGDFGYLINHHPLRVGSIFLSPFDMADFLLIAFAVSIERIARDFRSRASYAMCAAILAALFASRVRADALAAVIIAVLALAPTPNRPVAARLRLLASVLVAAIVVLPSLGGTRFVNAQGGSQSNRGHVTEFKVGFQQLVHNPLGLGIGNVAGVGDRFVLGAKQQGSFTVDNSVLQVGDELGIQALVPWLVMIVLVWRGLGRAAKRRADPFAGGIRLAFLAILVAGMYHHVFLGFTVAWALWAAMGLALRPDEHPAAAAGERSRGNIETIDAAPTDGQG